VEIGRDNRPVPEEPKKQANMNRIIILLLGYILVVCVIVKFLYHGEADLNSVLAAFGIVLAVTVPVSSVLWKFGIITVPMLCEKFREFYNRKARFKKLVEDRELSKPGSSEYQDIQNRIDILREYIANDKIEIRNLCVCKESDTFRKIFTALITVVLLTAAAVVSVAATVTVGFVSLQEESETSSANSSENDFLIVVEGNATDVGDVPYVGQHEVEDNFIYTGEAEHMISLTEEELRFLQLLVHWKAAGENEKGQILVVNVIFNRRNSPNFPNTVMGVIRQGGAFAVIERDDFETVAPSERTIRAINSALEGVDYSLGATHFRSLYGITPYVWHERAVRDGRLEFLFNHGGHRFYREIY